MKKISLFCFSLFVFHFALAQNPGEWMWIHGSSFANSGGNFGAKGVPSPTNEPPALYEPCEWTDLNGNFWFYGGIDASYSIGAHNDLWKYDPTTKMWTWMSGTNTLNDPGVYGIQGVASATNRPPGLSWAPTSWTDLNGNLWMYGGQLRSPLYTDLWKYDISTNMWTWMKGPGTLNSPGLYNIKGVPDTSSYPASRAEATGSWTDSVGDLWMFGGGGGSHNDMWRFNIASNTWIWMKGDSIWNQYSPYTTQGVEAPANNPPGGLVYSRWKDKSGNLWVFPRGSTTTNNTLWRYNPTTNNWAMMKGDTLVGAGVYGTKCVADNTTIPGQRTESRATWTDCKGNFWLFGGNANGGLNDLWMYNVSTNQWKWVSGDNFANAPGSWGTLNVSAPSNKPIGRMGSVSWTDGKGHLYLFGGCDAFYSSFYNDLWVYTIDSSCSGGVCSQSLPHADFTSSDTSICAEGGKCIDFTDHSTGNPTSWEWHFTGASPDTSSKQNPTHICYITAGTYSVSLIVTNASGTDTITVSPMITVGGPPPIPTITSVGNTLYSSHAWGYQWYFNGSPIPGATDSFYVALQSGIYSVMIADSLGCKSLSNGFPTRIDETNPDATVKIYPNPVSRLLAINFTVGVGLRRESRIEIYNVLGEKVFQSEITNPKSEIDVSGFAKGVYILQLYNRDKAYRAKFIKD